MAIEMAGVPEGPEVLEPTTAEEAWRLKRSLGAGAGYVSGGTLLRTQWENGVKPMPRHMISLEKVSELTGILMTGSHVSIGASVKLNECRAHPLIMRHGELLLKAIGEIAAPSIRHLATIGGNISSLTGDAVPALMAMNASLLLFREKAWRTESIVDWIQGRNGARDSDDLIGRVLLPAGNNGSGSPPSAVAEEPFSFYEKVGRREAFTPSLVTVAGQGRLSEDGVVQDIRLSAGGGTALPERLTEAERELGGARLSEGLLAAIHETIRHQYKAAEDVFAGSGYRKEASANLITSQLWKRLKS
ncbi:FAD binding domain-containing protein [Paenibacillus sp. PL2-23]|uniref:FAD binding domain-containing protein n=1 Tax=Paenibacillus sp. PL2-23 TaxID=2100729 RepID=UPI0030F9DC69